MKFFKSYCATYLHEDFAQAEWDHDDYFENVFQQIKYPNEYLGF